MTPTATAIEQAETRIARLEHALADYVLRYGLTDQARDLFRETPVRQNKEEHAAVLPGRKG